MIQNGDNLITKQNQFIEHELNKKPTFHGFYKEDRNRVRIFSGGKVVDEIPMAKRAYIGVTLIRSSTSDIPHSEKLSFINSAINSPIEEFTCPLGNMLNAAYKIIEIRINDEKIRGNDYNDLTTLKYLIDNLVEGGQRITPAYTLELFNALSYTPIQAVGDQPPFDYLVDCLADVVFHTLYHLRPLYPKGVYLKKCVNCYKLFFSGDAREIICYYPNTKTDSYFACQTERERKIVSQVPERKRLNTLLHRLRQRYRYRKKSDKNWLDEFNLAYRKKQVELKNNPMKYSKLLDWVNDYDSKDDYAKRKKR